jgi:hypothetical protein
MPKANLSPASPRPVSFRRLPDGGVAMALNFSKAGLVVKVSPKELAFIQKHIVALHQKLHGKSSVSGAAVSRSVRKAVVGLLRRRMSRIAHSGMMGAAARQATPSVKRPANPAQQRAAQQRATQQQRIAQQRAAQQQRIAQQRAAQQKLAQQRSAQQQAAQQKNAAMKQEQSELPQKIAVVRKALALIVERRARLLAAANRRMRPNQQEVSKARIYASNGFKKAGLPGGVGNHPFYKGKTLAQVADLSAKVVNTLNKPGEAPATPPAPPKPAPAQPAKPSPKQLTFVQNAILTITKRRAAMLAFEARKNTQTTHDDLKRGQAFAHQVFLKAGIPTTDAPSIFWRRPPGVISKKIQDAVKASEKQGAPANIPAKIQIDRSKLRVVQKGLNVIASRRAKFLALQRKAANVTPIDMRSGKQFARTFMNKNGVPSAAAEHVFWQQPIQIIATKVASVIKLAEVQGAPIPKPQPKTAVPGTMPVTPVPVSTEVPESKVDAIRQGLKLISDRRAKFLAFHRNASIPSDVDIRDGKDFARKFFVENQIPVQLPGKSTTIMGWVMRPGHRYLIGSSAEPVAVDPITAFWSRPLEVIQRQVAELVVKARDLGAPLEPNAQPVDLNPSPGGGGGGEPPAPGDMPPGEIPGEYPPGEIPGEYPPDQVPGEEYPGEMPGEEPPGEIPGEQYAAPEPEPDIPGQMPSDYAATDLPPGEMEQAPAGEYTEEIPGSYDGQPEPDAAYSEAAPPEEYAEEPAAYAEQAYAAEEAPPEMYLDVPEGEGFDAPEVSGPARRRSRTVRRFR